MVEEPARRICAVAREVGRPAARIYDLPHRRFQSAAPRLEPAPTAGFGALLIVWRGLVSYPNRFNMNATLAVLGLSGGELVLVLVVILVLFGARRIPEFAKGLGKGITEFKKASREVTDEIEREIDAPKPPPKAP